MELKFAVDNLCQHILTWHPVTDAPCGVDCTQTHRNRDPVRAQRISPGNHQHDQKAANCGKCERQLFYSKVQDVPLPRFPNQSGKCGRGPQATIISENQHIGFFPLFLFAQHLVLNIFLETLYRPGRGRATMLQAVLHGSELY